MTKYVTVEFILQYKTQESDYQPQIRRQFEYNSERTIVSYIQERVRLIFSLLAYRLKMFHHKQFITI